MDPTSTLTDLPEAAASPEPSSTRPNPFDDSDSCSRKRRRTSASGSPTISSQTVNPMVQLPESSSATKRDASAPGRSKSPELENKSNPPKTPEQQRISSGSPSEPPTSSRVTINLRHAQHSEPKSVSVSASTSTSEEPPTMPHPHSEAGFANCESEELKQSVEQPEVDMAPAPGLSPSPSSTSASPPIEIIAIEDTDIDVEDDMSLDAPHIRVDIGGGDIALADPTPQFPYKDPEDSLSETVNRLAQYISTQPSIDANVLEQVQVWLGLFLKFAKHSDPETVLESCRTNRELWLTFPEIFSALVSRRSSVIKFPALRASAMNLYYGLAELTAKFVALDCLTLDDLQFTLNSLNPQRPLLFSILYLQQLHALTRRESWTLEDDLAEVTESALTRPDEASVLAQQLQTKPGGSIDWLGRLATSIMELIPALPKMADSLAPVLWILTDCLRESCRIIRSGQHDAPRAKERLKLGHEIWDRLSSFFAIMVEKHVACLNSEGASCQIQGLTDMLSFCLQSDHETAVVVIKEHRQKHPRLAPTSTPDAIAWEWKFEILGRLIRSSQMQLRVMAVTTMCSDLVSVWKRLCDSIEEHNIAFLHHLGDCLIQNSLIDYLLGPNCHPEIMVESANIIGFLVITKKYRAEHTDRLWHDITTSQDPRVADALTRMIATITNLFDYTGLLNLCGKFKTLPIEGFNPAMRMLWDNVLRELMAKCQTDRATLTFLPYGICLRLLRESSVCTSGSQVAYPEMQQSVMQNFKELLAHGPDPQGRRELYSSCIKDISDKSPTTLGSLWCLSMAVRPAALGEMKILIERHDLARLIVEELEHAIEAGQMAGVSAVLSGGTNQPRRDFITNVIQLQPGAVTKDIGARLWDILVGTKSPCPEDRKAGWDIIIGISKRATSQNPFLRTCFLHYLPNLSSACFCEGMLEFVKKQVFSDVNGGSDFALDDEELVAQSSIEQLWRIILEGDDNNLAGLAINILAVGVYLKSRTITAYPCHRARQGHLMLVNRCLRQLKGAARHIKASSDGTSSGDDEPMVIVATEQEIGKHERIFIRSLQLLRFFLEAHQLEPGFSAPDLRSLMSQEPHQVEGDPVQLKYQSFDGTLQTDVKPLNIGKLNTAASLLASLRRETGFDNYRVYYRGRPFLPSEDDICKSLEDLHVYDGLMLVRREEGGTSTPVRIKPGSSPLEIEILSHFQEMWTYLSMNDIIAKEIYTFLVRLPVDGHIIGLFENDQTCYNDVFFPGQPFKSLYTVHALAEYTDTARITTSSKIRGIGQNEFSNTSSEAAMTKTLSLIVHAISDANLLEGITAQLQVELMTSLMGSFMHLLQEAYGAANLSELDSSEIPSADRLVSILSTAVEAVDEDAIALINSTLAVIMRLSLLRPQFWETISTNEVLVNIIRRLILFDGRKALRTVVIGQIESVVEAERHHTEAVMAGTSQANHLPPNALVRYFWPIITSLLIEAVKLPDQCHEYFDVFPFLLVKASTMLPAEFDFRLLSQQICELLVQLTSTEQIGEPEPCDPVAKGLVSILHLCLQIDETLAVSSCLPDDLASQLFWRHLFPPRSYQPGRQCSNVILNTEIRAKLCEIIFRLVRQDRYRFDMMLDAVESLVPYYASGEDDPYLYELPWQFDRSKAIRSQWGYVGLRNLSNTCYLNSLLTQLFMNTQFRQFVMARKPAASQKLLFETQKLFGYMQESYLRFVDPGHVVSTIKTYEDTPIDIHSQMDVDEFYNLLFDRWEGQLTAEDEKKALRSFYGGQLVQQVKSKECDHISERLEPFSAIQCDIKGKSTLQESLQAYVDGEIMDGDNKYKCSTCDRHVDAVKRACLKDIPDNLIFHLKRFDFNLRTLQRNKINDYFSFPPTIDLQPYTIEHLSDSVTEESEDIFELVGILVHSGTAESGHYYSYIRERPSSAGRPGWMEFNDDVVVPWDPALLESSTFGGPDHRSVYDTNGVVYDKTYSAYMLFYQRATALKLDQQALSVQGMTAPMRVETDPLLSEHISVENDIYLRRHCLFDPSHIIFVQNLFGQAKFLNESKPVSPAEPKETQDDGGEQSRPHKLKDLAFKMAMSHFDQVVTRTKDFPHLETFSTMIRSAVLGCSGCAFAYYDYFSNRHAALRGMLQRNPESVVRQLTGQLLISALERISIDLPQKYHSAALRSGSIEDESETDEHGVRIYSGISVMEDVVRMFNYLWRYFHIHIRAWDEYFGAILEFARLGDREVAQLLANDYLLKLLRIIAADSSMDLPQNYARMLHHILRRVNNRPPSYSAIVRVIDHLLQHLEPELSPEHIVGSPVDRLYHPGPPFPWTDSEVQIIHMGTDDQLSSLFVEKLIAMDQAPENTRRVIGRLVATGEHMDVSILNALRRNTHGDISTQPIDPFLRAAAKYLEFTQSANNAQAMIQHICLQAKSLQSTEGSTCLDFFKTALNLGRPDRDLAKEIRAMGMNMIPAWAPFLLVYADSIVRNGTEQFVEEELFELVFADPTDEEDESKLEERQAAEEVIRKLGMRCLVYLREAHVKRRAHIGREAASIMQRMIGKCGACFEDEAGPTPEEKAEFLVLQGEVIAPLRRLIVDEVEEDGSDWEGSCISSEQILEDHTEPKVQSVTDSSDMVFIQTF